MNTIINVRFWWSENILRILTQKFSLTRISSKTNWTTPALTHCNYWTGLGNDELLLFRRVELFIKRRDLLLPNDFWAFWEHLHLGEPKFLAKIQIIGIDRMTKYKNLQTFWYMQSINLLDRVRSRSWDVFSTWSHIISLVSWSRSHYSFASLEGKRDAEYLIISSVRNKLC